MEENLTIKDKIFTFLKKKGITKTEFYAETGIESSNFKGKNKDSLPGSAMLVKILTKYPDLSAEWLLTGRGDMLKTNSTPTDTPPDEPHSYNIKDKENPSDNQNNDPFFLAASPREGIPLIPFSAMAGALKGEQTVLEYECERYVVPAFSGADFLMPVKGDSMSPTYLSGDIVACQRVPMSGLFFQWNKPYVLDTAQGAIIKRIKPGSDKQHVLIVSDNKEYDPFELPYEDIYAVALVIGIIRLE